MAKLTTPDTVKKWLPCMKCRNAMWTDRCHRTCKDCKRRAETTPTPPRATPHGVTLMALAACLEVLP